jgi:guanosine-3',5'-bis(diphosphate) 3'-pyrophosphohydrolase
MKYLVKDAIHLATTAHINQTRKYSGLPYILHPLEVACVLSKYTNNYKEIAAAILHDVIEDCDEIYSVSIKKLDVEVHQLVLELTNENHPTNFNRAKRKELDREHIKKASFQAKRIKLIDRTCNLKDMHRVDDDFRIVYANESLLLLECLRNVNDELEKELEDIIITLKGLGV